MIVVVVVVLLLGLTIVLLTAREIKAGVELFYPTKF
jgi:hypothetical protein